MIISFICPLLYYLLFTGLIVLISKRTFGKCLPLAFMINAFIYFFSAFIFKTFKVGFILNILLPIIFIVYVLYKYKKKELKDINEFKKNYFSDGMIAFITIFIGVFIFDLNRTFSIWDEWSHWGVMIKEMLRLDNFYSIPESVLFIHKDYPPIVQLFEMFYSQISGGYNESYLIRSLHLLEFSLFIPVIIENDKKINYTKTIIDTILIVMIVYLILLLFDVSGIVNAIYIDFLLPIIIAYLMSNIIFEKDTTTNFNLILYMLGFSFILLTKQMGLPLFLMILFIYIVDIIIKNFKDIKNYVKSNKLLLLKIFVMLIVIPLLIYKGWDMYITKVDAYRQFDISNIKISQLPGILSASEGEEWQKETARNYIYGLKTQKLTTSYINLSYLQCFMLSLLLLYIVYYMGKKTYKKEQIILSAFTISCGYIGYAFVMLLLYVFLFGPYEGPILASFCRYMGSYVLIPLYFILMLIIQLETSNKNKNRLNILILLFGILFLIQKPNMLEKCFPKIRRDYANQYQVHAERIMSQTKDNSKIYVLAQDSYGEYQYPIQYYSLPRKINIGAFAFIIDDKIKDYEKTFNEKYKEIVSEYEYFYIATLNDDFIDNYSFLFENPDDIKENNIFKIVKEDNKIILKKI